MPVGMGISTGTMAEAGKNTITETGTRSSVPITWISARRDRREISRSVAPELVARLPTATAICPASK